MKNKDIIFGELNISQLFREVQNLKKENQDLKNLIQKKMEVQDILQKSEVREMLGVCDKTLHNWDKSGKLKLRGIGGRRYYFRKDVDNLLQFN